MKKIQLTVLSLIFTIAAHAMQIGDAKISHIDSIKLNKTWVQFKAALSSKDMNLLRQLSLAKVIGEHFYESIDPNVPYQSFVSKNKLLPQLASDEFTKKIIKGNYRMILTASDQYQLWFTIKRGKNQPGMQIVIVFLKLRGKFKFYGLDSLP